MITSFEFHFLVGCPSNYVLCGENSCDPKEKYCMKDGVDICKGATQEEIDFIFEDCECPFAQIRSPETFKCLNKNEVNPRQRKS
jgi:hypothetical protein